MSAVGPLRAAVVGVRGMGREHCKVLSGLAECRLEAVCDLDEAVASVCAGEFGVQAFTDFEKMLVEVLPDVVVVATSNASHAALTVAAARAGVRGVLCEKPMAVNLANARAMVAACEEAGTVLAVNHQRRVGADFVEARRLIRARAIGEVLEWRGYCAGDMLSDGTHAVDSLLWLAGDAPVVLVAGHVERESGTGGDTRYGQPVESGAWGMLELGDGRKIEVFSGSYQQRRAYQEYEVVGTKGRIWRVGDMLRPDLFIQDAAGGDLDREFDRAKWHAVPVPAPAGRGRWRAVPGAEYGDALAEAYRKLVAAMVLGDPNPMAGDVALRGFECVMAIYESARIGARVELPLRQERFPLEIMVEERGVPGQASGQR